MVVEIEPDNSQSLDNEYPTRQDFDQYVMYKQTDPIDLPQVSSL